MVPGDYPIETAKNAEFAERWSIDGISTTVGYGATVEVRTGEDDGTNSTLLLQLASGSGLTLSTSGGALHVDVVMTEAQIDSIYDDLVAVGADYGYYSLKLTRPAGGPQQWLKGTFTVVPTPTA